MCEQPPYSMLVRGIEADVLPVCLKYDMGVIPWSPLAGGWLSGKYRKGQDLPSTHRSRRIPQRYDMALPGNQRKLDAADALAELADEAGISLIDMAVAFVLHHPAVTSAIIGPRTMDQLEDQLAAHEVVLSDDVLDRIDEIVPPGTNLNPADAGYQSPALTSALRRRRSQPAPTCVGPAAPCCSWPPTGRARPEASSATCGWPRSTAPPGVSCGCPPTPGPGRRPIAGAGRHRPPR